MAVETRCQVTLIAAGEQQTIDTGEKIVYVKKKARRVFAVEDYLGCGAIISYTMLLKNTEADDDWEDYYEKNRHCWWTWS